MKPSEVYRKAAMMVEKYESRFACEAIGAILNGGEFSWEEDHPLLLLFRPKHLSQDGGGYWGYDESGPRILALCFMAAIAEDEERSRKRRS